MKYAIVESGGKQFKAVEGSSIVVDLLKSEAGQSVDLDVLLLVDGDKITVGT
ncbi:50S ribosomal protein L21, partial [bacterium]|nr:50S ribosomal protein L21 [bacterium]